MRDEPPRVAPGEGSALRLRRRSRSARPETGRTDPGAPPPLHDRPRDAAGGSLIGAAHGRRAPSVCQASVVQEERATPSLHPLLATRWSPTTFDAELEVPRSDVEVLLDAARWAPSAGNSQPWAFIVGRRGDETHERLLRHLGGSSARWAPTASLLIANLSHRYVEDTDWEYSEFSQYDLGQAVAHMTLQAQALGLSVRQFRAFDRDGLAAEFAVPAHWEVTTMSAVGRVPRPGQDQAGDRGSALPGRQRRSVEEVVWPVG